MKESEITLEYAQEAHKRWLIKNNQKDLDKAIEYYSKTLSTNPNVPEGYYRLALLLWESGRISLTSAIEKCKLALTMNPNDINARMYTGYFLKLAGKSDEAEKEFKKAVDIAPLSSARARLNLGLLNCERLANHDITVPRIAKSLYYITSGTLTGLFDYSNIKMSMQKIKETFSVGTYLAAGNILKLFRLEKNAVKTFKIACKKTGRPEIFNKLIGDIDVKLANIEDALNAYDRVLEVNPTDREALLKKATILQTYFEDKTDAAIEAYTQALNTKGDKNYIYYELGHLYLKKNNVINAINAFKLAVEEDKTNPYFHNALGFALFTAGQYEEAEDHYLVAINLNPYEEWTATVCRAAALIYSDINKKPEKAIRMYQQSLSLSPDCAETYTSLADLYFDLEDYDNAVENYAKSISLDSANSYAFSKFATSLWQKGYIEEAIIAYKQAIDKNPEYAAAYNNLGAVYLDGKNMIEEAKYCFAQAIMLDKKYTMAYFNAARAYELSGDKVSAAKLYGKANIINKETKDIENIDIEEKIHELFEI